MLSWVKNKYLLIVIGTAAWSVTMVKSGWLYGFGVGFWGANGHDGVWHLAIANSLSQGRLVMPVMAGLPLQNYHYGFDLLLAVLHRITFLPLQLLYFQILPPLLAFGIGILVYRLVKNWSGSEASAWWTVFFVYFSSSLGVFLGKGESVFWAQQSLSTLINPPYALSLLIILAGLLCLHSRRLLIAGILFGLLLPIKVYAGLLALAGLFLVSLLDRRYFLTFFVTLILGISLFLPFNSGSAGLIRFYPGWFLENLFAPDRLDRPALLSALNTFRVGGIWYKAIPAFTLAFLVFLVGNLGLRLMFLFLPWQKNFRTRLTEPVNIFLVSVFLIGSLIPMLFIQQGTAWNTIQFFYYSQFAAAVLSGIAVGNFFQRFAKSKLLIGFVAAIIVILTASSVFDTLQHYLPSRPPAKISPAELSALRFLATQPQGTVLTQPFDKNAAQAQVNNPPRSLYFYESTAYVSAYSGQPVFLEDEINLNITAYPWQPRRRNAEDFFSSPTSKFLVENQISYIYLVKNYSLPNLNILNISQIFENPEVIIYSTEPL